MLRTTKFPALAVLVLLLVAAPVFAGATTYTTESSFAAATTGLTTENFDGAALGSVTGPIDGLTFTANIAGGGMLSIANTFDTTSGTQYLGSSLPGNSFASQDNFTVTLPSASTAVGMYLLIGGPLSGDDFTLSVAGGDAMNSAVPEETLGDGTIVYFLGLTSTTPFTSATLGLTTPAGAADGPYWNVDDLSYGTANGSMTPPVPEPSSLLLLGAGLAAVVRRVKKA